MNKAFKISISVFLIVAAKAILDIILFSTFLKSIQDFNLLKILGYTILAGVFIILIYNKLQRLYPFIAAVSFVFYVIATQFFLFYGYPSLIENDYTILCIPSFIVIGNLLIFLLFKGISSRLSDENFSTTEKTINLAKYAGLIAGGLFIIFFVLNKKIEDQTFYYSSSLILFILGFFYLINLILTSETGNDIVDNPQVVKVTNKIRKMVANPFFIALIFTSAVISILLTLSFRIFTVNTLQNYEDFSTIVRLFGFYTLFMGILGILYEVFLRQKLILYLGIKNVLAILPVFLTILAASFILNNFTNLFSRNPDWYFIFMIITIFMMIFSHFSFENITIPTTYAFYLPISVEIRHDFYIKSFILGIFGGIGIGSLVVYGLMHWLPFTEIQILPFAILVFVVILFLLNLKPVYKNYRNELQNYLNVQSRNIIVNRGLFKDIENNNPDNFKGIQFLRYLNLLYLSNPVLARKAINISIDSENNLTQRISLIKASEICMLETMDKLQDIKQTKYFPSSPNRDKIEAVINRFLEVTHRMENKNYVSQLSISKEDSERVFGAKLAYYSNAKDKSKIVSRLLKDPNLPVVINAIISSQEIDNIKLIKEITDKLDTPALGNAAYSTLLSCGEIVLPIIEESYYETGQSEKVQLRIIQLYGDIANQEATEYLLKKLNISNQNIISATLSALSKCNLALSEEKTAMLKHELEELCSILIWNMSLLIDLKKSNCSEVLKNAIQVEVNTNYESMFNLLSLLYDSRSVKLIRNSLFSNDFEKISFALELASVLLKDEIKLLVLPILQPLSIEDKVAYMQDQIPTEHLERRDVLYTLIQRDSKWMNQWTKACAMSELTEDNNDIDLPILLANMINPDPMLAELAASSVIKIDRKQYFENKKIFGERYINLFDQTVLERIESTINGQEDYPVMKYEIINNLQKVTEFSNISGEILKRLTDYILPVKVNAGELLEKIDDIDVQNYFYILYSGNISLFVNDCFVKSFNEGSFISTLDLLPDEQQNFILYCEKDSVLYRISSYGFIELLTIFDLIPESIVRKTDNSKLLEYEEFIKKRTIRDSQHRSIKELITNSEN